MYSNRKKFKIQGKTSAHKKALVRSLTTELLRNGRLKTTPTKAKVLKKEFDRLVTSYKKGSTSGIQKVKSALGENDRAFDRLEKVVKEKLSDRNSGYTRVIKTLPRKGDNAEQAYVMLVNTEYQDKKSKIKDLLQKRDAKAPKRRGIPGIAQAVDSVRNTGRQNVIRKSEEKRRVST